MFMTHTTHTPGPWNIVSTATRFEINDSEQFPILRINGGMIPIEANARLIAAAPELLEPLEYFTAFAELNDDGEDERFTAMLATAHAAIAKATGKPA
jgi:hypothetical protein